MYDLERMQTDKPADWIAKVAAQNPATLLPSGNVRVFGRGAFVNVAAPAKDSTPTKASENAVAPSLAGQPKTVDSRAYYELAAKVLRLPGDQSPEVRRLQEDLRKSLAPALLPEASK